jgi:hypothetical protein
MLLLLFLIFLWFIYPYVVLFSFFLRFIYVPAPHTAEVITDVLHEVLLDWHIERNLSTITLDNCSTNDSVMKNMIGSNNDQLRISMNAMQGKLPLSSCMLKGKLVHMRCACHILNLIVKDGMSVMEHGIDSLREIVGFWSATPKRHEKFEKMAIQMTGKYEKRITLDCKTRWNSTYTMLSTALLYQDVFERLAARAPCVPTTEDWKFAKDLCDRLKLFYDVTELLSGTNYVTANIFFPKITNIYLSIRKWQVSDIPKVQEMSCKMRDKFNKYWSDVHGLMAVGAVLDPRFKLQLLNALFLKIHGSECTATESVNNVKDILYNLVLEYQDSMEAVATSVGAQCRSISAPSDMLDEDWMDTFDDYMSKQPTITSTYVRTELDLYLEEPLLPRTQELDIIQWWQHAGLKYPTLRKIARDVLAIPVSTVASESVFSTGGRIISPHRSRLAPSMVEALMCMQAWSRADMLGILSNL